MANYRIKGLPKIKLLNLLKKKRTNLKEFLSNSGIASYQTLLLKCANMGVDSPSEQEFNDALGPIVSSPQEGVIVLDPPNLVKDQTGAKIQVDDFKIPQPISSQKNPSKKSKDRLPSQEKSIEIDESIFIVSVPETLSKPEDFTVPEIGEQSTVEDNIDNSVSKLTNLKKK